MAIDPTYRLLSLCARAEGHPEFKEQLKGQLDEFSAWQGLPAQAETHGMAPLLWHHLRSIQAGIPAETAHALRGLYMRHRLMNEIHTRVLMEIVEKLGKAGIQPLVLKGLALACEYYPDPALRPISDLDLLFKQEELLPALHLLVKAGYKAELPRADQKRLPKELTALSPPMDGISVRIELHHYDPQGRSVFDHTLDEEFLGFDAAPHTVKAGDGEFLVPDPMDTLHYLIRHLTRHLFVATASNPLPLKWIADVISLVERHAASVDWAQNSALLNRLEVFYSLTPMPENLLKVIPIRQIPPAEDAGRYPQGWPQRVYPQWKRGGSLSHITRMRASLAFIMQTLSVPPAWWLRVYYGIDEDAVVWYGNVVYRMQVLRMIPWKLLQRLM